VWFLARKDAEKAMEAVNGKVIKKAGGKAKAQGEGRPVAVDWALSKEKWEETQQPAKGEPKEGSISASESSASSEDDSDSGESSSSNTTKEDVEMDGMEKGGSDGPNDDDEAVKPQLPSVDVGSTLFIRNLPFETTEQELNTL